VLDFIIISIVYSCYSSKNTEVITMNLTMSLHHGGGGILK